MGKDTDFLQYCLHDDKPLPASVGRIDWMKMIDVMPLYFIYCVCRLRMVLKRRMNIFVGTILVLFLWT
jgi:hypothetical protein